MRSAQTITRDSARQLLQGFAERQVPTAALSAPTLRHFLGQFTVAQGKAVKTQLADAHAQLMHLQDTLERFAKAEERWRQAEESTATSFNVLDALDVTGRELLHSSVLAWLLSRNIHDAGSHTQGSLGLWLFATELRQLGVPVEWADHPYSVAREVPGEKSRIDIEIACPGVFLIHIENKVWAPLGEAQLDREWKDLESRREYLNVPSNAIKAIFLTPTGRPPGLPHGRPPSHEWFRPLAWSDVARVFDRFAETAKAPMVSLFAAHYADAVRKCIANTSFERENDNGEADIQRGRNLPLGELGTGPRL